MMSSSFSIGTNRTIGTNRPSKLPCTQLDHMGITSFSIVTNRTIGTNGPSELTNRIRLCILDMSGGSSSFFFLWIYLSSIKNIQQYITDTTYITYTGYDTDILPGYKRDHSLISIHRADNANPRGPGFWKLNTSPLLDEEYVGLIKKTITDPANECVNNNETYAILLWDTMKMQIRSSSPNYARRKKAKMKSLESKLESEILSLQKELEENNVSENEKVQIYSEIDVKILQREEISKYKTQRAMPRSKSRWHNEGEKNTKYFLNLEKRHFSKKKEKHQTRHISK